MRTAFHNTATILLLAASAAPVYAAEWKIDPTIQFRAGYNDNVRLNIDDEISSAEARLSPSAVFSAATPTSGASGELRFDFRRFEDDSDLNENNFHILTNAYHRMERSELGLDLDESIELRVWDSSSEVRYLVLPERPDGTEGFVEADLAKLVTRDSMIGVAKANGP